MADAPVTTTIEDGVAVLRFDDGKVNVLSFAAIDSLSEGLDLAEKDAKAVCIVGREGAFSAGFDLSVMTKGIDAALELTGHGGQLMMRLFMHPQPVVAAVTGHALAAGALLSAVCDIRIGADRPSKIGLNEAAIGMSLPGFAVELARDRLNPAALVRATLAAEVFDPHAAVEAGWLDRVVPEVECAAAAIDEARRLGEYNSAAFAQSKKMLRTPIVERVAEATSRDAFRIEEA